jgi:hypothetical protein
MPWASAAAWTPCCSETRPKHGRIFTALLRKRGGLRWPWPKAAVLAAGIQAIYLYERLGGWRRMVSLREPARRDALGGRPPARQGPATGAHQTA